MLFLHEFPGETVDSNNKAWANLRSEAGGLKLALHCTSWRAWLSVWVLYLGGQPLWTSYAATVRDVKSPHDGLKKTMSLANDQWLGEEQFQGLVNVLLKSETFERIGQYLEFAKRHVPEGSDCNMESFVQQLFFYVLNLLGKRASSLSKFNLPPDAYAQLLSSDEDLSQASLDLLLFDWKNLVAIESHPKHKLLASDLALAVSPPVRLAYQCYELGKAQSAKKILKGLLLVLPDSKIIEDIHGKVRNDARANAKKAQTFNQVQQVIVGSGMIESRGIPHPPAVTKNVFKRRWSSTSGKRSFRSAFVPKSEKLPKSFSLIMGPKTWAAITEKSLHRSAAAWTLLRHFVQKNLRNHGVSLQAFQLTLVHVFVNVF